MPGFEDWNWQIELLHRCNWSMGLEKSWSINTLMWTGNVAVVGRNKIKDLRKQILNPWECHQARGEYHRLNRRREKSKSYLLLSNKFLTSAIETELRFSWEKKFEVETSAYQWFFCMCTRMSITSHPWKKRMKSIWVKKHWSFWNHFLKMPNVAL